MMEAKERPGTLRGRGTHYEVSPNESRKDCVREYCVETTQNV